jgi:hypothetical protein
VAARLAAEHRPPPRDCVVVAVVLCVPMQLVVRDHIAPVVAEAVAGNVFMRAALDPSGA